MEKFPSKEQGQELDKEKLAKEIENLHNQYIELEPLINEGINIYNKPEEIEKKSYDERQKGITPVELERVREIDAKKRNITEKIQEQVKNAIKFFNKNFSISDWKSLPLGANFEKGQWTAKISDNYTLRISLLEFSPGEPVGNPFEKYHTEYLAEIVGEKKIKEETLNKIKAEESSGYKGKISTGLRKFNIGFRKLNIEMFPGDSSSAIVVVIEDIQPISEKNFDDLPEGDYRRGLEELINKLKR